MPELPEVQTVVSDLNKKIKGSLIVDFWTDWGKAIKDCSVASFKRKIKNKKVSKVERRAKNILIHLDDGQVMLVHLKMTGHLLLKKNKVSEKEKEFFDERVNQYIHHIWYLRGDSNDSNGHTNDSNDEYDMSLEFSDLRKFGKIQLFKNGQHQSYHKFRKIGLFEIRQS